MAENTPAARREARRRRILENSEERLKRITGSIRPDKKDGIHPKLGVENGPLGTSDHLGEDIRNGPLTNRCKYSTTEDRLYGPTFHNIDAQDVDPLSRLLASAAERIPFPEKRNTVQKKTFLRSVQESRFHIVVFAILVRLLIYFDYGFIFGESVLVTLLVVELTDIALMFLVTLAMPSSLPGGLLATMLMFNGMAPGKASSIGMCLSICIKISQDFALYLVCFLLTHCLLDWPGWPGWPG